VPTPSPTTSTAPPRRARWGAPAVLLVLGILLLAFNLRPALTSVPPLFPELEADLGLSTTTLTWLATVPELCFAAVAAVAAPLARRYGEELVLGVALALLALALVVRGAAPDAMIFPGTIFAAGAIATMNVLLSSLIKRRQPERAGLVLGLYLLLMHVGAMLGSAASVPLYERADRSVGLALGIWAVPAVVALVVWLPQLRQATRPAASTPKSERPRLLRSTLAWQVAFFMGLQSFIYYAALSWFPSMLRDRGASAEEAGVLVSLLAVGGLASSLVLPILAHRMTDQRRLVVPSIALSVIGIAGAWFAPLGSAAVWILLLGLGQGAAMGLSLYFMMARSSTPATAAALSGMSQSWGYLIASVGPLLVGLLHDLTDGWAASIGLLLVIAVATMVTGVLAGRPLFVDAPAGRR
jgi:CP family cyanate transporter-like MFS transporter